MNKTLLSNYNRADLPVRMNGHQSAMRERECVVLESSPACGELPAGAGARPPASDWLLWQIVDSAFPTGGFAHSNGLEAAWQCGAVRDGEQLGRYTEVSLRQVGGASLPFVTEAFGTPARLPEIDRLCDVFTTNHVANRASRLQGRALLSATARIFREGPLPAPFGHLAPAFGAVTNALRLDRIAALRLFLFQHMRSLVAAAVRLNIVGPIEGQRIQHGLAATGEAIVQSSVSLGLEDVAQTAPVLDLWQGLHDRLYSRLFQS